MDEPKIRRRRSPHNSNEIPQPTEVIPPSFPPYTPENPPNHSNIQKVHLPRKNSKKKKNCFVLIVAIIIESLIIIFLTLAIVIFSFNGWTDQGIIGFVNGIIVTPTPIPTPTHTPIPTPTYTPKIEYVYITPQPTFTPTPSPIPTATPTPLIEYVYITPVPTPSPAPTPTPDKTKSKEDLLDNTIDYPTDYGIVVNKCTWEMNEGFYSPVIQIEVRNNTGSPSKKITVKVVFYDDNNTMVWDDRNIYLVSSSDTPLKNGFSKTGMVRSARGYKKYISSNQLPNISYEIYINNTLYFDGYIKNPGNSNDIQSAISAAKKLKSMLKNPNSIQLHAAYIQRTGTNPNIVLEISAQNGFGGLNRKYYKCNMSGTTCISCSEYDYFDLLYKSEYRELDVSLIAPSVEK